MDDLFEWDSEKAHSNFRKHGVTFDEALTAFSDPLSLTIPDPLHSDDENRFVTVGLSSNQRQIVIVHTERNDRIRIISARLANSGEKKKYEQENGR